MIFILTLGYNNAQIMREGLFRMFATGTLPRDQFRHIILDQHYPNGRDEVISLFDELKNKHGSEIMDFGINLGLNAGWNWMCEKLDPADSDIIIGYDPDSWPRIPGWDSMIVQALQPWRESKIPWVSAASDNTYAMPGAKYRNVTLNGVGGIVPTSHPCWMQSICGFIWEPLKRVGNFQGPTAYYGELEKTLYPLYRDLGYDMAWLPHVWDEFKHLVHLEDPLYREWKVKHALDRTVKEDFATWIKNKG